MSTVTDHKYPEMSLDIFSLLTYRKALLACLLGDKYPRRINPTHRLIQFISVTARIHTET